MIDDIIAEEYGKGFVIDEGFSTKDSIPHATYMFLANVMNIYLGYFLYHVQHRHFPMLAQMVF